MRTKRQFVSEMLDTIDQAARRGEITVKDMLTISAGIYTMVYIHAQRVMSEEGKTKLEIDDLMLGSFKELVKECNDWIIERKRSR